MPKKKTSRADSSQSRPDVGLCLVYDRAGNELWRKPEFRVGVDRVPRALSGTMGAMVVVSDDGERIAKWNPWGAI